ncbi:MAG TPA: FtsX-like permease family protein, partial [Gammaproteobacteria bacterium]|nr:FtsX-like permease family protein [Gammaproteobacteria bacterium]
NVAAALEHDFPDVEAAARLSGRNVDLRRGNVRGSEKVYWADPQIFSVLPLKAVAGNLDAALERSDGIVLSRSIAVKYFGRVGVVGETIEVNREHPMTVAAVVEDLPSNTTLDSGIFLSSRAPFSRLSLLDAHSGVAQDKYLLASTYLRLAPGASIDALRRGIPAFISRHLPSEISRYRDLHLRPIASLHLGYGAEGARRRSTISAMVDIAILIVLVASINFINLMTARGSRRAVEVGTRKVAGADRRHLIVQFIGESLIYTGIAALAAVAMAEWLLPAFNGFLDRGIVFDYWRRPALIGGLLGLSLVVGVLAGVYPAVMLSAFKPAAVWNGGIFRADGAGRVRQLLVVLQFSILIGLMLATGIIYGQIEYAMNGFLRFDHERIVVIENTSCSASFKTAIAALPGVHAAACACHSYPAAAELSGAQRVSFDAVPADFGLLALYGLKPMAGRFFSAQSPAALPGGRSEMNPPVVISETAARELGFASPAAAVGRTLVWQRTLASRKTMATALPSQIIGVVADLPQDVRERIQPTIYYIDPAMFSAQAIWGVLPSGYMYIKLGGRAAAGTLAAIDRVWGQRGEPRPIDRSFLDQRLQDQYLDITHQEQLFGAFAGVALFIACLGLFGLSVFTAERRTREIGIRKATGASRWDIVKLLVWEFGKPVLLANLIAWPIGGYVMHRWLAGFAYHVSLQAGPFLAAGGATLAIALLTVLGYTLLIARQKPVAALRYE